MNRHLYYNLAYSTKGIVWKLVSLSLFVIGNALVRYLSKKTTSPLPISEIIFLQYFIGSLFLLPILNKRKLDKLWKFKHRLHISRAIICSFSITLMYCSYQYLTMLQSAILSIIGTALMTFCAVLFLKEKITLSKSIAFALTIIGSLLIGYKKELSGINFNPYILLPIGAIITFSINKLISRKILANDPKNAYESTLYLFIFLIPTSGIIAYCSSWQTIYVTHIPYILILSISAVLANYAHAKAYAYAEVTLLIPVNYAKIILSAIAGYICFNEFPQEINQWFGMLLILLGILTLSRQKEAQWLTNSKRLIRI